MPFATLLDPIYASPTSDQIIQYTRCGDSALWTGAYLAAESFRYKVTQSADALQNVKVALAGLKALSDVTGDNRLARCIVLANSPYAASIANEEANNSIHQNSPWIWVDNTSRDQVVGAFFGLGVAFDLVDDPSVKAVASDVATRLIGFISRHQWSPNDDISSTFQLRPEELQTLLQVARHVNPANTVSGPFLVAPVGTAVQVDVQSNSSYFKFNLDYMSFYHLVRLQDNGDNRSAYMTVRNYTASHQNAFFNMIDRALRGPDAARDAETRTLLDQWLLRPRRDVTVDVSSKVAVCGSAACQPVPVALRPPATFLWEVDPFHLQGGGSGIIENAGVDYILPYWMARYYGVINERRPHSICGGGEQRDRARFARFPVRAESLGHDCPGRSAAAADLLGRRHAGGDRFRRGTALRAAAVRFAEPDQFPGSGQRLCGQRDFRRRWRGSGTERLLRTVQAVAPTLFSMNGNGSGVAAALAVAVQAGNPQVQSPVPVFQCGGAGCVPVPIALGVDRPVYVSFYGTGIRNRSSLGNVTVTINGVSVPVLFAGPAPDYVGLDQVNVGLPLTLRGSGECNVVVSVDGQTSNTVTINIQ